MFTNLIWVLGDQLNKESNLLQGLNKASDAVLMIESLCFAREHKHHKKKLIFQFSAMRHFAQELESIGITVLYIDLESELSKLNFSDILKEILEQQKTISSLSMMEAADYDCRVLQKELQLQLQLNKIKIEIVPNDLFISTQEDIDNQFKGKKNFLMETYYRYLRKKHNVLMEPNGKPTQGQWNFDKENRKPLKNSNLSLFQHIPDYKPDKITLKVIELVEKLFPDHYGKADGFKYAINRAQALEHLDIFLDKALIHFGDFQDAMSENQPYLFHGLISYLINFGLLHPMEVIKKAEEEFQKTHIPINSVEGFIRQILGWREYIYVIYSLEMHEKNGEYRKKNYFDFQKSLPEFFWTGKTKMNCLKNCIGQTIDLAYAHHIQRLMVIGNFCLLAGINPQEVCEWYLIVYIDALEWVELPNTLGMSQYGDGGIVGTKPYVSSGKYIQRMSDYCKNCDYAIDESLTESACPFNYLYWNFLISHREKFKSNPRIGIAMKNASNKSDEEIQKIKELSIKFLKSLK